VPLYPEKHPKGEIIDALVFYVSELFENLLVHFVRSAALCIEKLGEKWRMLPIGLH
jgi:hypothetical protein